MSTEKLVDEISQANDLVEQTFYLEQKVFEYTRKVNKNKERISRFMGRRNNLNVKVDERTEFFATKKVEPNIQFFPDKLKKKLDKNKYKDVVDKTITVDDYNALVRFLKTYKVPPKEFKKYLSVCDNVDNEKLSHLIDVGEIGIDDIQGCYNVEFEEEIRVKKIK